MTLMKEMWLRPLLEVSNGEDYAKYPTHGLIVITSWRRHFGRPLEKCSLLSVGS